MGELLVGAALSNFGETQGQEDRDHLTRLEDREAGHLRRDGLNPYELGLEPRLAVLKEHGYDFLEIRGQLFARLALRMRTREPGHIADKEACLKVLLNHRGEFSHELHLHTLRVRVNDTLPGT